MPTSARDGVGTVPYIFHIRKLWMLRSDFL